jgi:asparagine synthase (glutamine-hydrolysing)
LLRELRGEVATDDSDLRLVVGCFTRWGRAGFARMVGDWALSVWIPRERQLILACDYLCVRHIFYSKKLGRFWWSTDLASLVLLARERFHLDENYVAGYLSLAPDALQTPYREIRQVPPGHLVCISDTKISAERYWHLKPSPIRYQNDADYENHFRHLFRQSVRRRLRASTPVLSELSGGLDSSSIVCMADDILTSEGMDGQRLDTISYYDKTEHASDDWMYFPKIEEKRGRTGAHVDASSLPNSKLLLDAGEFNALPGSLGIGRELEIERDAILRKGGYRVVLSGMGGDEFLGGVPDPSALLADLIVRFNLSRLWSELLAWSLEKRRPTLHLLWRACAEFLPPTLHAFLSGGANREAWIRLSLQSPEQSLRRALGHRIPAMLPTFRQYAVGLGLMANTIAKRMPRPSGLAETRYPFLDRDLIEFLVAIPADQLLRPGQRRSLMRRTLAGLVPPEIISRTTKQFGSRTPTLAIRENLPTFRQMFSGSEAARLGHIDERLFLLTLEDMENGKKVHIARVLKTIALEVWLRNLEQRGILAESDAKVFAHNESTRFHHSEGWKLHNERR